MRKISAKKYAQALYQATVGLDQEQIKFEVGNFIKILIKNKSLKLAGRVIAEFEKYSQEQAGILDVEVFSAFALSGMAEKELAEQVKAVSAGGGNKVNKVNIVSQEDDSLLGGLVVKIGDQVLDASLKTRLNLLKQNLR